MKVPFWSAIVLISALLSASPVNGQFNTALDIESEPIRYSETEGNNRVTRLMQKIADGDLKLEYEERRGHLESLLQALDIKPSSQTLVFSKTSMQVRYISRRNPRAIYFNDDTYVGWVYGSSLVEISTADPKLGAAFYTLDMAPWRPKFEQSTYICLGCHATTMTQGIPGHTVRSVYPAYDGSVDSQLQSFVTTDKSPFRERWGGWYVTGLHGDMKHMGNAHSKRGTLDTSRSSNLKNLHDEFDTTNYLSPYSDIVALMVLEHQTQMHNTLTRANFAVRKQQYEASRREVSDEEKQEATVHLSKIATNVVEQMLFCGENQLTDEVRGSVIFSDDFQSRGKKDNKGRSLRQFDLKTRLFRYPCSYLIHSEAFASLEPTLRTEIVKQIREVLEGETVEDKYSHLTKDTRADILSILSETHPDFK